MLFIAVFRDRNPADEFHHEIGTPGGGAAGIINFGDIGVVHHREGLALGVEARDDGLGVHAEFDHLQREAAAHRFLLLGHPDHAAATFADLLQEPIATDPVARFFLGREGGPRGERGGSQALRVLVRRQQADQFGQQRNIGAAGLREEDRTLGGW